MKIAAILENPIHVGGGFNQALNAITQLIRIADPADEVIVFTTIADNLPYLHQLGIPAESLGSAPAGLPGKVWRRFGRVAGRILPRAASSDRPGAIERALLQAEVDLAYFVTHSSTPDSFRRLNFITTVLDLCHRDNLEFPEVSADGQFDSREAHFSRCLPRAFAVIAASDLLADSIVTRYGVDRDRMIGMPFEPSPFLTDAHSEPTVSVLREHGLEPGYFFYPAQFWPHKNHVRILEAMAAINARQPEGTRLRAVFSGSDHGNKVHLEQTASRLGVREQIRFLGFVPVGHMRALYQGCAAVVMPSYFGPTNIPPLEGWTLERPVVYSAHLSEHTGDAALLIDPDDADSLADGMLRALDPSTAAELIPKGQAQLQYLADLRAQAESQLLARLRQFSQRRKCWA